MTKKLNILMSAVATAALLAPSAFAWEEDDTTVYIDQVQLGNVFSDMTVWVDDHVDGDVAAGATSVGNAAAAQVMTGNVTYEAAQVMEGNTAAYTGIEGGSVLGAVTASTTSYANASTPGTWMGNTQALAHQTNNGVVSAVTEVDLVNVNTVATSTTAIANVSNPSSEFGDNRSFSQQTNNNSVYAVTDADLCCDNDSASFSTIASGNAVTSTGWSSTVINGAVQTNNGGDSVIAAHSDVYIANGNNVAGSAASAGNSYTLTNEFGYATLGRQGSELFQGNEAAIVSESYVTLDNWDNKAKSTSYGVGNSALINNVGSDTGLFANQENYGSVSSTASLTGDSYTGGTGVVNATAIGNAATANLCTACGDAALYGSVSQINGGSQAASANMYTGHAGNVYGSATAVGNSATFTASGD